MTEEFAVLLRKAAEKWPEKFSIDHVDAIDADYFSLGNKQCVCLDHAAELITLDFCDAIAGAVEMEFSVLYTKGEWTVMIWRTSGETYYFYEPHTTKRAASLAALCAILKYKLGDA